MVEQAEISQLLTIKEAARILRVHQNTVKKLIATGKLPSFKIERVIRISQDDLKQYMEESRRGTGK